jgi:hypothetical protein
MATVAKATARDATLTAPPAEGALWAEVTASPPPEPLVLAAAVRADPDDGQDYAGLAGRVARAGGKPDLVPILVDGTVALAGGDGVLDPGAPAPPPASTPEPGETEAEALARTLETPPMAFACARRWPGPPAAPDRQAPVIEMAIDRRPAAVEARGMRPAPGPAAPWTGPGVRPLRPALADADQPLGQAQDVSVLYMAADFTVQPIWPQQNLVEPAGPGGIRAASGCRSRPAAVAGA